MNNRRHECPSPAAMGDPLADLDRVIASTEATVADLRRMNKALIEAAGGSKTAVGAPCSFRGRHGKVQVTIARIGGSGWVQET